MTVNTAEVAASLSAEFEFLRSGQKDHVAIICHDQPDPDCLASALAMQAVASTIYGLQSTIYFGGEIGHTQNRVMVNVLNIHAHRLDPDDIENEEARSAIADRLSKSYIVLVDVSQFGRQPCESIAAFVPKDREPDLVIDHHEPNSKLTCRYIRRPYGSCSTIMCRILRELDVPISKTLATALYVGISTDTANLRAEGVTDDDREAFDSLKSFLDPEAYEAILNYPRSTAIIEMRRRVYNSIKTYGNLAIANAGIITTNQRSLIAELCDELLQVESVETGAVMAIVDEGPRGEKYLVASFRSHVLAINMSDFIGKTFGKKFGGGRKGAGAAKIPVDPILRTVIDDLRAKSDGSVDVFTDSIFHAYAERVRSEIANI